MPSNRPKVQSYLSPEAYNRIEAIAGGESISKTVEAILTEATDENAIVLILEEDDMRLLKQLANDGYRPIKDQAKMAILEWLKLQKVEQQT